MSQPTPEQFMQRIVDVGLANRLTVEQARAELGSGEASLQDIVRVMQRRGILTTLQSEKLLRGDRTGFFYGQYKVLYLIGAGTFARVYRATKLGDLETGDDATKGQDIFAVKVLRKRFRDEVAQLDQFLREGRMGLKLRHPNIVNVYEVNPDVRYPFMVIEFIEGQTLREMCRLQGKIEPLTACKLMLNIASGLAYAATLGISHRDMKLSNVLVGSDGVAKLVDFGLAALADRNNPEKIADCPNARAIDYAALERGTGVRKDDPRSDIYFAGAIMYHMLAGQPAMPDTRDRLQRLNISRFRDVKPLHQVAEGLPVPAVQICQKAMALNPAERYQKASEMEADLKKAIARLEAGPTTVVGKDGAVPESDEEEATAEGEGYVVMLVESKPALQDVIRARLKNRGYRVLVFSDPQRALDRFDPIDDPPADLVVFGAADLGSDALDAFNQLGQNEHTAEIPAILLVDRRQTHIISNAETSKTRRLLPLPLKVRDLRTVLAKLLAGKARGGAGAR